MNKNLKNSSPFPQFMQIQLQKGDISSYKGDALAVALFEDDIALPDTVFPAFPAEINAEVQHLLRSKEFHPEFGETYFISTLGKLPARQLLLAGLGKKQDYSLEKLRRIAAIVLRAAKHHSIKHYASLIQQQGNFPREGRIYAAAEGTLLAAYDFIQFKTEGREKLKGVESCTLLESAAITPALQKLLEKCQTIAEATNYVRTLVNLPPNIVNPAYLAQEALKLKNPVNVTVFGKEELKKKGFNGILAVGSGSMQEPKLVTLDYSPAGAKKSIALVGKGITFDSGGLNLKPATHIETMKMDMAGAAVVLGVIKAAAQLKLPIRIIGIFPACENMPSGSSYRPDDILTMYNKKTVEMINTDAEGRIILADALSYAESFKPGQIIDFATLTGACIVALGYWATGLLTANDKIASRLINAGEETGDRVWRLPLWEDYKDILKSDLADVRNLGKGYDAGTIQGAVFLSHFVKDTPWAHLDLAGTAFWHEAKYYHPKGATGAGVRLLVRYLEKL